MENGCELVFSEQAADFLLLLEKSRLTSLLYDLRKLANDPFLRVDYSLFDDQGRKIDHLMIGDVVVAFWVDHAVKELRIVDLTDIR